MEMSKVDGAEAGRLRLIIFAFQDKCQGINEPVAYPCRET